MNRLDIAIAGCGPAGLTAALLLHRDGHRITLFERFDAPRPVGSGILLQPTGLAVLAQLGLDQRTIALGSRVDRLIGQAEPSGRVVLDVRYSALGGGRFGVGLHRASLFDILHSAAQTVDIAIETGREATGLQAGPRPRLEFADGGVSTPFDLVIDATGSHSVLANASGQPLAYGAFWASLDWPYDSPLNLSALEQRYRAASIMVGVMPIGCPPMVGARRQAAFFWSLRGEHLPVWRQAGLDAWKQEVLTLWPAVEPLLDQVDHQDGLTYARYVHRTLPAPVSSGVVHIGDAWHATSPQLGQGANMAMLDAYALAKALREHGEVAEAQAAYVRSRRSHVRLYQAMSALLTPFYQSDSRWLPFVRDRLAGPLSKVWPATTLQAAMVSGLLGAPLRPLGLAD